MKSERREKTVEEKEKEKERNRNKKRDAFAVSSIHYD